MDMLCEICKNKIKGKRTIRQNSSLHLYFFLLAEALNDAGFDMKKTIRQDVDISWTPYTVKEYLWRPMQEALLGKRSTTRLKKNDIDKVFEHVNRTIGERTGVYVPWPCAEELFKH